jgi:hypothetical protein
VPTSCAGITLPFRQFDQHTGSHAVAYHVIPDKIAPIW